MNKVRNIVIANYSIHSLALIIWAKQNLLNDFCILSVDTGFASNNWNKYLERVFSWLEKQDINYFHLKAEHSFSELVNARRQFPSQQFSWCAGFLKGITLLNKIDTLDPNAEATILLSHRKDLSKVSQLLKNIDEEEKYDYRKLEYPLLDKTFEDIAHLIKDLPFKPANHSFECHPCIHMTQGEFKNISSEDIKKVISLEKQINACMFLGQPFDSLKDGLFSNKDILQELSKACSWEYSCGL
ncbi:hypothetical protein IB642_04460 [Allofrancisella guangzhouensis]|uniref:Uncharacterized protein n=1 Tax=Allofrancisella guangzhouensis TaxID=594679 RepID=A0A0A8E980_9GAMM|nr:hypothetical protein [Allofrancisella guangzhouensis]AJC48716.1 hypothetical protein SD28_03190 [Allofrancisella guangzhouensis]MBK2026810.1 hypothetical protein [Allofrancisella guangzhouensis]MBK2044271.1 hypothetical protein [Allofrancisella guangzhouensis]MBK2045179.1 hypothetical protein [Allofrancisella guangzhouensis]